ncbi:hypothetical protein JMJ99_01060 [Companilactobacillus zhachilii]|uniref:hypothetical protein n=1 Tax=Companilactobacillus zhachilii TaxID=2304606 RepID=UPI001921580A|nr:hypothetical protein [Companilactobacillus zhachilii]MBL3529938.1 hypothetical protein [Companilactobacillus zhachilii]
MREAYRKTKKKKWYRKKRNWIILSISIIIGLTINNIGNFHERSIKNDSDKIQRNISKKIIHTKTKNSASKSNDKNSSNFKKNQIQTNEINKSIASHLKEDKGFAKGTLDENGKPTENGKPNPQFYWTNYVVKITVSAEN